MVRAMLVNFSSITKNIEKKASYFKAKNFFFLTLLDTYFCFVLYFLIIFTFTILINKFKNTFSFAPVFFLVVIFFKGYAC